MLIVQADPDYEPPAREKREVFGVTLEQDRNHARIGTDIVQRVVTQRTEIPDDILQTLIVATIALKYTQSNSICVAWDGQVIGMGAGQQSRIHCTRLACAKAEKWMLQQHPRVLGLEFRPGLKRVDKTNVVDQFLLWDDLSETERRAVAEQLEALPEPITAEEREEWIRGFDGICLSSDAFFPFRDNIDRASRTNVQYLLHPGGSVRDEQVIAAADQYGMVLAESGVRCFLH
jgi:phosphoribosylaminoimidazolecarboxamide formyltransferase/IMP cyclohydrolase